MTTPGKYRFVLSFVLHSELGNLELKNAPLEWNDMQLVLKRNMETHGVDLTAVVGGLTFIKEGKQLLERLYAEKGIFAICSLYIYYLDYTTREYVAMPTSYKLDFNTYRVVKLIKSANGVQINALQNDIVSKFQQRKNTTVNLNNLTGLSGFTIPQYTALPSYMVLPSISVRKFATYSNTEVYGYDNTTTGLEYVYLKTLIVQSDFTESRDIIFSAGVLDHLKGLFQTTVEEVVIDITGTISVVVNSLNDTFTLKLIQVDASDNIVTAYTISAITTTGTKSIAVDQEVTMLAGNSLVLVAEMKASSIYDVDFGAVSINMVQVVSESEVTTGVYSMPIYEAMERCLQIMLDKRFPFYSEFFGREDVVTNTSDDIYAAENQLRFASIASGLHLRGAELLAANIPVTFNSLFKTMQAIWNVGGCFEMVDNELRYRIEDMAYFYQDVEAVDLSGRVTGIEVEIEQDGEAMFARLKTGYAKYTYDAILGRGEYNTSHERTTVVPNDQEFNNVAPLRADTRGILSQIEKPLSSEDVQGDEDVFIVKTQRLPDSVNWVGETSENITIEGATSLFDTGSLNLYFSPVRNLIRHGREINAGLDKVPGTKIAYQLSDKNNLLETTGEGYTIKESDDITASDLASPLWLPERVLVEVPFYEEDFVLLSANPHGYITISDTIQGWVVECNYEFTKNVANFILKRKIC